MIRKPVSFMSFESGPCLEVLDKSVALAQKLTSKYKLKNSP